ncbi:MAG TPA: chemotaxis protein CheB [Thermoanaerobaculia bacterium]|nr:chemotaxis protein CheB [Thermoanaerobaculia bacterium]
METRDIILLGASAGGVEPLRRIASDLEPDLPASVFVVLHVSSDQPSALPEILNRAGPLPAFVPRDGQRVERGRIYVAPPDTHLILEPGVVRLAHGPRENRHRPSVDVLFRSAARAYGPRVTGVVLSGSLDDGTAGLIAIKIRGGVAVVQDPAEAFCADMPRNATRYIEVDHVLPARAIGPLLNHLVLEQVDPATAPPASPEMIQETKIARLDPGELDTENKPGVSSVVACPDCRGVLWEIQEGDLLRFRCRTGHAYSPETLLQAEDEGVEAALWEVLRALEERVSLRRRLVKQAKDRHLPSLASEFERRVSALERAAGGLRELLLRRADREVGAGKP